MTKEQIQAEAEARYTQWDNMYLCSRRAFIECGEWMQGQSNFEDNPLVDAVYEGAEQWKQEYDDCRILLQSLVTLKEIKDTAGKTDYYNEHQPKAWEAAKEFLKKYQHSK